MSAMLIAIESKGDTVERRRLELTISLVQQNPHIRAILLIDPENGADENREIGCAIAIQITYRDHGRSVQGRSKRHRGELPDVRWRDHMHRFLQGSAGKIAHIGDE